MWSKRFWQDALERALKTGLQVAAAMIGTGMVGVLDVDWAQIGSVAGMAAILSVITSVASDPVGKKGTPSLVA